MKELTITYSSQVQNNDNWLNPDFAEESLVADEYFENLQKCTSELFVIENECEDGSIQYYQFCYNANEDCKDVYAYEIDKNGEPKNLSESRNVQICRIFSKYPFKDGEELKVIISDKKILINQYESEGSLSEIGAKDGILELLENSEAIVSSDNQNETEALVTAEVTNAVSEVYNEEGTSTDNVVAEVQLTSIPVLNEKNDNNNSSTMLAVFLIIAVIIALIFGGGAVYFFMQMNKQKNELDKLKNECSELKKKSTEDNKKNQSEKVAEIEQIQELKKEISQKEEKIIELNGKLQSTKNIATMAMEYKDKNDELKKQIAEIKNDLIGKDNEVEELRKELDSEKTKANELKTQLKQNQEEREDATVKEETKSQQVQKESISTIARKISIDTKIADEWTAKDSNSKFLNVNSSLAGDVTLSEAGSYRTAPLICIQNKIFLNPYYYSKLINDSENYEKIASIKNVFEIEGFSNMSKSTYYGLEYIHPAIVEKAKNNYKIKQIGKIKFK